MKCKTRLKLNIKLVNPRYLSKLSFFFNQNCLKLWEVPKERTHVHKTAFKHKGTGLWEEPV